MTRPNLKLKKGDRVLVHAGKDRGKTGKILAAFPVERRVIVEGLNIVKKHIRPRQSGAKGQRVEIPAPMPTSRLLLICPSCSKATRVGIKREVSGERGTIRQRVCKKCGGVIV